MPMFNLIEYSDSSSDTLRSLCGFKRDKIANNANVTNDDDASSFKYKASFVGNTEANGRKNEVKIAVPVKCLSNFWRPLEMHLINCKTELSLAWIDNCVLSAAENGGDANAADADSSTFKINDAQIYVPVVTLSTEHNVNLRKQLSEGFKRSVYLNKYKVIPNQSEDGANNSKHIRGMFNSSYQGVKRLCVLAYNNTVDSFKKYFLSRRKIENYNVEIDGMIFFDEPIKNLIKQHDEVRKVSTGQGDDYETGSLLDFAYFKEN